MSTGSTVIHNKITASIWLIMPQHYVWLYYKQLLGEGFDDIRKAHEQSN